MDEFGARLRALRDERGWSLREFAATVNHSKSSLSAWETGTKTPAPEIAAELDQALDADGTLAALAESDAHQKVVQESERLTAQLLAARPGDLVDLAESNTARLAHDYLAHPGAALLDEITEARRGVLTALRARGLRNPAQVRDLYADIGYLSGVLAYAALDDGKPAAAIAHTQAAWEAADLIGSDQIRAWVRGTQSLILRFDQRYPEALARAEDGLRYAKTGTARARLLAGVGQCHANMADARAARRALVGAETAMDAMTVGDDMGGLFTFSRAKLYYYSGSSLIWLDGGDDARRAQTQAHTAIALWEASGERSVADEALARVYAATAALQLHELEGAEVELAPILSAGGGGVSWIGKRLDRVAGMLGDPPYLGDPVAAQLLERIEAA